MQQKKQIMNFLKKKNIDAIGLTSPHSVTVPGALDAWKNIHKDFGKLDFEELFLAAINFAKNGFEVTKIVSNAWNKNLNKLSQNKNSKNVFLNNGNSYQLSDLRKNIPLGNTLELISKKVLVSFMKVQLQMIWSNL